MPIIKSSQYQFTYNHSRSVNQNFDDWRMLNHEERSAWNESLLTYEESIDVFEAQYSVKVSTKTVDK